MGGTAEAAVQKIIYNRCLNFGDGLMLKAQLAGGAALSRYGREEGTARRAPTAQAGSLRYQCFAEQASRLLSPFSQRKQKTNYLMQDMII